MYFLAVQCKLRLITVARHGRERWACPLTNCNAKRARVCGWVEWSVVRGCGVRTRTLGRIAKFSFARWQSGASRRSSASPPGYWQKSKRSRMGGLSGLNGKRWRDFLLPATAPFFCRHLRRRLIVASKQIRLKLIRRFAFIRPLAGCKVCSCVGKHTMAKGETTDTACG